LLCSVIYKLLEAESLFVGMPASFLYINPFHTIPRIVVSRAVR